MIEETDRGVIITYDDVTFIVDYEREVFDIKKNGLTITIPVLTLNKLNNAIDHLNTKLGVKMQDQLNGLFGEDKAPSLEEIKAQSNPIVDYIFDNYSSQEANRLANIKMVAVVLFTPDKSDSEKEEMIDKIAVFNGIQKRS